MSSVTNAQLKDIHAQLKDISTHFNIKRSQDSSNRQEAAAPQERRGPFGGVQVLPMPMIGFGNGNGGSSSGIQMFAGDSASIDKVFKREDKKSDNSRATAAAVVGGVALIAIVAASAKGLSNYNNDRALLKKAENVKHKLELQPGSNDEIILGFTEVNDAAIKSLEAKCARSRNILIITGMAAATAAAAFLGGMLSVQWLITASIITGVALLAIAGFMIVSAYTVTDELPSDFDTKMNQLLRSCEAREPKPCSVPARAAAASSVSSVSMSSSSSSASSVSEPGEAPASNEQAAAPESKVPATDHEGAVALSSLASAAI